MNSSILAQYTPTEVTTHAVVLNWASVSAAVIVLVLVFLAGRKFEKRRSKRKP